MSLTTAPPQPDSLQAPSAARPVRAFPRPGREAPGGTAPVAAWVGGPSALREEVADHVEAAGGRLLDAAAAGSAPAVVLGTLTSLSRRHGRTGVGHPSAIVALTEAPASDERAWRSALELGARALIRLPEDSARLLGVLGDLLRRGPGALILGVAAGSGGAGASSLAARLAGAAVRGGHPTVLVDADPCGGGLDVLVEAPAHDGATWEDIGPLGSEDGEALRAGLPEVDGVRLLAARGSTLPAPEDAAAVLAALAPGGGIVIADLGTAHVAAALAHLDQLLVVVTGTDHSLRAAQRRAASWEAPRSRTRMVLRRRGPLGPRDVAEDLGSDPLLAFKDAPAGLVPLLDVRRGGIDAACAHALAGLLAEREQARA